jgi:hypothetical protein
MSDQNGIKQTPFSEAWPTPGVGGTGINAIGGGIDMGGDGGNGIVSSPFDKAVVPTPSGQCTPVPDLGGEPPYTAQVDGGSPAGSHAPWDITSSRNTVDQR